MFRNTPASEGLHAAAGSAVGGGSSLSRNSGPSPNFRTALGSLRSQSGSLAARCALHGVAEGREDLPSDEEGGGEEEEEDTLPPHDVDDDDMFAMDGNDDLGVGALQLGGAGRPGEFAL